jgi:hypothetical protein
MESTSTGGRPASTQRWTWILLAAASLSYANLRLVMNHEFADARWQQLIDMTAPMPYVGRLLVPRLLHFWQSHATVDLQTMFMTVESAATFALVLGMRATLRRFIGERPATLAAVALLWGLAVPFLLEHRWPIYYPYDTPSMAFIAWGLWAAVCSRPLALAALSLVGAVNRETAVLLPLLGFLLWWPTTSLATAARRVAPAVAGFAVGRLVVWWATRALPGPTASFFVNGRPRFANNVEWFNLGLHSFQTVLFFLALPLAYLAFRAWIPLELRLVRLPLVAHFGGLMAVGNVYEPRIFGEIIVAIYLPVVVGALGWASERPVLPDGGAAAGSSLARWVDRVPWGTCVFLGWWGLGTLYLHSPVVAAWFGGR